MRAVLLSLLLVGCGMDSPEWDDNHGYGWTFDVQCESGIKLRYTPTLYPGGFAYEQLSNCHFYDTTLQRMSDCTGIPLPQRRPFIVVLRRDQMPLDQVSGETRGGYHYYSPSLILVDETATHLRHENLHFLKFQATGNGDPDHLDPQFAYPNGCVWTVPWI